MTRCGNKTCNKSLAIIRRIKRCQICNIQLCKKCFTREGPDISLFILRGYCSNCLRILKEDPSLSQIPPPEPPEIPLPSKKEVIST